MKVNVLVQRVEEIDDRLYTAEETKKGIMTNLVRIEVEGDVLTFVGNNTIHDTADGAEKITAIYSSTETNETWIIK